MQTATPNPVVRSTRLRAVPGWMVREYANGMYDAREIDGIGLTVGCDSFAEAVAEAREQEGIEAPDWDPGSVVFSPYI